MAKRASGPMLLARLPVPSPRRSQNDAMATLNQHQYMDYGSEEENERVRGELLQLTIQSGNFQRLLDRVNSVEFNGIANRIAISASGRAFFCRDVLYLNDEMAQALGIVLLDKKDKIKELTLPIGCMSRDVSQYPALLSYFRTAMPSSRLIILGDPIFAKYSPVTTHEILDVLLSNMVKQNRSLPQLQIHFVKLSPTSMAYLKSSPEIKFIQCDIDEQDGERPVMEPWSASDIIFHQSSARLMTASWNWIPKVGNLPMFSVSMDPSAPDREEGIHFAIQYTMMHRDRNFEQKIRLGNIDTDGSSVVEVMKQLTSHPKLEVTIDWTEEVTFNEAAIRSRAQEIVEAASHCRFHRFAITIRGEESIFDDHQMDAVNEICAVNRWLPHNVDTQPEEFWMNNLLLLKQLLTPEYLFHPRFQDVYYRLLRKNFNVLDNIMSWYKVPPAPATMNTGTPEPEA